MREAVVTQRDAEALLGLHATHRHEIEDALASLDGDELAGEIADLLRASR